MGKFKVMKYACKSGRLKPWVTEGIITSINFKRKLYRKFKANVMDQDVFLYFQKYKNMLTN